MSRPMPTGEPSNGHRRTHGRLGYRLQDDPRRTTVGAFTKGTRLEAPLNPSPITYTGVTSADLPVDGRGESLAWRPGHTRPTVPTPAYRVKSARRKVAPTAPRLAHLHACQGCGLTLLPSGRCPDVDAHRVVPSA